jgi:hypothetical protein
MWSTYARVAAHIDASRCPPAPVYAWTASTRYPQLSSCSWSTAAFPLRIGRESR